MLNNLRYVLVTGLLLLTVEQLKAQGDCENPTYPYPCCCDDCSCSLCGDILECTELELPPFSGDPESWCGTGTLTWWANNTAGVVGEDRGDGAPTDCIPIDGGLGFLIAGGLGIGVIGIRRRKEELELERD